MSPRQEITQHCLSNSGETFSGPTAGDAPATGEQTPRVCASWGVGYNIPCSNGLLDGSEKLCGTSRASGTGHLVRKSGQRRLHRLLAW